MKLETMSEVELFFCIRAVGQLAWRLNHDAADGRIENTPDIDREIERLYTLQHNAVSQLSRFGITPFTSDGKTPTETYRKWYDRWDRYLSRLSDEEYALLEGRINACENTSDVRPI